MKFLLLTFIYLILCDLSYAQPSDDYIYYMNGKNKPLLVIFPENQSLLLTPQTLKKLKNKFSVLFIPFQSEADHIRQKQLDGLNQRRNHFSQILDAFYNQFNIKPQFFLAEGFNSHIVFGIATAYQAHTVFLLNGYNSTLHDAIINACFSSDTTTCNDLITHLKIKDENQLNQLLQFSYNPNYFPDFGNYSSNFWQEVMNYSSIEERSYFKENQIWIYTSKSGMMKENQINKLIKPSNKTYFKIIDSSQLLDKPLNIIRNKSY